MFNYEAELDVGDQRAENDWNLLASHFVTIGTTAFVQTQKPAIILGRKGSGKSALRMHFERDASVPLKRIISLQPAPEDLRDMFERILDEDHPLFSVETIAQVWALCIYANVLKILASGTASTSLKLSRTLRGIVGAATPNFNPLSLGDLLGKLNASKTTNTGLAGLVVEAKRTSERALSARPETYYVLIDSVDEAMHNILDTTRRTDLFATFFEGLLSFTRDFTNAERNPLANKVYLKLFIPIDVYDWSIARHADHLRGYKHYIDWSEGELLEFIAARLEHNLSERDIRLLHGTVNAVDRRQTIWEIFFPKFIHLDYYAVSGTRAATHRTQEFLLKLTLRRPRDMMELVRQIDVETKKQRATFPSEDAIFKAIQAYSYELRATVEAEYENVLPEIHAILSNLSGNSTVFEKNTIEELIGQVLNHDEVKVNRAMQILYQACVIGIIEGSYDRRNPEAVRDHRFYYDLPNWSAVQNHPAYVIHRAFWHSLQLQSLRSGRSSSYRG